MKKLLLAVLIFCASASWAQMQDMYATKGRATSSWTEITKSTYERIFYFEVTNDTSVAVTSDSLFVAFDDDTSGTRRFPLLGGEVITFSNVSVAKVQIRASGANAIPYRVRYH